jgi:hypothetical protein
MTLSNRLLCVLPIALIVLAAPSHGQEGEPDATATEPEANSDQFGGTEIIVTGRELDMSERTVTRQARTISRENDLRHTPLARFGEYACPGVGGLKLESAEIVVARIRFIAEDLGIPLRAAGKCEPNIIIMFTEDGRADLAAMERKTRAISLNVSQKEKRELLEAAGPVRVFNVVQDRMRNGITLPKRRDLVNIPTGSQEGGQSLISRGIRRDITTSFVLFDREGVRGKTLHQLADYAAMRVFAQTRDASGEQAPDSILSLFDEDALPPDGLTAFDRAFLTTLYESQPHISGLGNLQRVAHVLKKQMSPEDEADE